MLPTPRNSTSSCQHRRIVASSRQTHCQHKKSRSCCAPLSHRNASAGKTASHLHPSLTATDLASRGFPKIQISTRNDGRTRIVSRWSRPSGGQRTEEEELEQWCVQRIVLAGYLTTSEARADVESKCSDRAVGGEAQTNTSGEMGSIDFPHAEVNGDLNICIKIMHVSHVSLSQYRSEARKRTQESFCECEDLNHQINLYVTSRPPPPVIHHHTSSSVLLPQPFFVHPSVRPPSSFCSSMHTHIHKYS